MKETSAEIYTSDKLKDLAERGTMCQVFKYSHPQMNGKEYPGVQHHVAKQSALQNKASANRSDTNLRNIQTGVKQLAWKAQTN